MIRVSGLPVDVDVNEPELDKLFLPYGKIERKEIKRDKSAAIAEVELNGDVSAAANELNGKLFRGHCRLTVEAHPVVKGQSTYNSVKPNQIGDKSNDNGDKSNDKK